MLLRVTSVGYTTEDGETIVQVSGRGQDGEKHTRLVTGVPPWFYAPEDERVPEEDYIQKVEAGYESYDDIPLNRVVVTEPSDVNDFTNESGKYKDHFSDEYEADIPFYRKAAIFHGLSGHIDVPRDQKYVDISDITTDIDINADEEIEPRIVMGDIEVNPGDESFEEMQENASQPIISISLWDSYEDEYTVIFWDKQDNFSPTALKEELLEHWDGRDDHIEKYVDGDIELLRCGSEEDLLREFIGYMQDVEPDLLSGWNWVDFDHDYLIKRLRDSPVPHWKISPFGSFSGYQVERMIEGLPGFDMMDAFCDKMTFHEWRSTSLDYVSMKELGVGKVDNINIGYAWENELERLIAYSLIDTQLLVELDREKQIHDFFYQIADLSSVMIYDTFSEMRIVDGYIMSRRDDDEVLPCCSEKDINENAGGYVLPAGSGLMENIGVFDLASLYPSAIITWNISPETLTTDMDEADLTIPFVPEPKNVSGPITADMIDWNFFGTTIDEEGLIPKYLKRVFKVRNGMKETRDEYDPDSNLYEVWDRKQAAIKVIMNSFYGVLSMSFWRLSVEHIGDAVTSAARYTLWKGIQVSKDMGHEVYYSDTDSVFLDFGDLSGLDEALEVGFELEDQINERMNEIADDIGLGDTHPFLDGSLHGTHRQCLYWEFEKFYESFIQVGKKKRYAGYITWEEGKEVDDIDIKGFESKRADSPEVTEETQKKVLEKILKRREFREISDYVKEQMEPLHEREEVRSYALPGGLNKPAEEYPNREIPRACMYSNEWLDKDFGEGDDMFVYYVQGVPSGYPNTDVIALEWNEDVPDGFELNTDDMLRRSFEKPLEPILEEMGWTWAEVETGRKVEGLDLNGADGIDISTEEENDEEEPDEEEEEAESGVLDF